jgi:hypothetical protein
MFHVQPHRYTRKFDDGVTHVVAGTPELVNPSRLKWAAEDALAVQPDRVEAVAIFDPQFATSSRATHACLFSPHDPTSIPKRLAEMKS